MIGDTLVIDGVVHGYNSPPESYTHPISAQASFALRARESLERLPGISSVDVQLDHEMDWSPRDLNPAYAARLAQVRRVKRDDMSARASGPEA